MLPENNGYMFSLFVDEVENLFSIFGSSGTEELGVCEYV